MIITWPRPQKVPVAIGVIKYFSRKKKLSKSPLFEYRKNSKIWDT